MRMVCGVIGRDRYDVYRSSDTRNDCIDRHVRLEQPERVVGMKITVGDVMKSKANVRDYLSTHPTNGRIYVNADCSDVVLVDKTSEWDELKKQNEMLRESIKGYALAVEIYSEMPLEQAMKKLLEIVKEEA